MKVLIAIFYGLTVVIEFLYSIPETIVTSVGERITDLSDAMQRVYIKSKEKQVEKNN